MELVLVAEGLKKAFGTIDAVNGISIELGKGQCLSLLGPNGAGKTTTVEMLEGLISPDEGRVEIFGQSLASHRHAILEKVGVVLQDTNLYKKLSVRETFELFASFYRDPIPVDDIIHEMELSEKADARLEHLSGGQKQRVYIGCGLINRPDLVFLDEPTTGLDPQARRMIWKLIDKLKDRGCSILLTTHYMEEAEELSDRVAIIDRGRIIASGTPKQLIEKYCGEKVIRFQIRSGKVEEHVIALQAGVPWLQNCQILQSEVLAPIDNPIRGIVELSNAANDLGIEVHELEFRQGNLEDVFLNITGRSIRDE